MRAMAATVGAMVGLPAATIGAMVGASWLPKMVPARGQAVPVLPTHVPATGRVQVATAVMVALRRRPVQPGPLNTPLGRGQLFEYMNNSNSNNDIETRDN